MEARAEVRTGLVPRAVVARVAAGATRPVVVRAEAEALTRAAAVKVEAVVVVERVVGVEVKVAEVGAVAPANQHDPRGSLDTVRFGDCTRATRTEVVASD